MESARARGATMGIGNNGAVGCGEKCRCTAYAVYMQHTYTRVKKLRIGLWDMSIT
jgi:hypothetical protein